MKAPSRRIIKLIVYLLLLAASVVWISFEGGTLPYLTFFTLLLQYPMFLIYSLYVNHALKIHQESSSRHLKKGEAQDFKLVLENSGFLPVGALFLNVEDKASRIYEKWDDPKTFTDTEKTGSAGKLMNTEKRDSAGNPVNSEDSFRSGYTDRSEDRKNPASLSKTRFEIMPGKRLEKEMNLICFYAGTYPVGVLSFAITDPFGIFKMTFEVPQKYRAIVRPEITDEAGRKLAEKLPSEEAQFQNENASDDILGSEFKRYASGDRKSAVHWKLYAKTGELYTRIPEKRNVGMFTVLLGAERIREESIEDIIMRDGFLTLAVSFAYCFAMQKKPVEMVFCRGDWKSFIVDSYASFEEFYTEITGGIYYGGAGEEGEAFYKEKERSLRASGKRVFMIYEKDTDRS